MRNVPFKLPYFRQYQIRKIITQRKAESFKCKSLTSVLVVVVVFSHESSGSSDYDLISYLEIVFFFLEDENSINSKATKDPTVSNMIHVPQSHDQIFNMLPRKYLRTRQAYKSH